VRAVIDTNILLVANGQHEAASPDCVIECVQRLQYMERSGIIVVDDGYRIIGEYLNKTSPNQPKGAGDIFLKWLLRQASTTHIESVALNERAQYCFAEFPDPVLEPLFDEKDRVFAAVANAHLSKPPIWQAVDCKWLNWWGALQAKGVEVVFLCPADVHTFYCKKFPGRDLPSLPEPSQ
jgi:hypothetical protein